MKYILHYGMDRGINFRGVCHMWTQSTMDFSQSLLVSGLGLMVVFSALIVMALAIIVGAKVFSAFNKKSDKNDQASGVSDIAAENSTADEEACAVLLAVISEEMHAPIDSFRIKEIKEVV